MTTWTPWQSETYELKGYLLCQEICRCLYCKCVKEGRSSIPNGGNIESCGRCLYRKNVFSPIPRPIVIWIEGIAGFLTLWLQYLIGTELNKVSFS